MVEGLEEVFVRHADVGHPLVQPARLLAGQRKADEATRRRDVRRALRDEEAVRRRRLLHARPPALAAPHVLGPDERTPETENEMRKRSGG